MPSNLDLLVRQFPGKLFLSVPDAARAYGLAPKTARNQIALGVFPVKTVKIGGRRVVPILAFAEFLDKQSDQPRRGPGRPRSTREGV